MTVPWLSTVNSSPWTSAQPVYNRLVEVHRNRTIAGATDIVGETGYSGAEQGLVSLEGEVVLFTKLVASIQLGAAGSRTATAGTNLPGDAVTKPVWTILIFASNVTLYDIRDRDIIVDDEGYRYEVGANQWTGLGYQLSTIRLEA